MPHSRVPKDAIVIRWGRFHAAIAGRFAMLTVLGLGVLVFVGRYLGLW